MACIIEASICSLSLRRPLKKKKKKESLSNNSVLLFSISVFRSRTNSSVSPQFLSSPFNARMHAHKHTHIRAQTSMNSHSAVSGKAHTQTHTEGERGRATAAHSRKQTDREMSKSSQDESCMQIVLLTVSFPYSLTTLPQQRYRDGPRKTEGCGERESRKAERKERIVSSYNRVDWRGPY